MRIDDIINRWARLPDGWVRLEQIRWIPHGLELSLAVHSGRRGKAIQRCRVDCMSVRDFQINDFDGGGLAIYPSMHPAARQYSPRQARLRWSGVDRRLALGILCKSNADEAYDWARLDYYLVHAISEGKDTCQGPDFLMRAYAKALRAAGAQVQVVLSTPKTKTTRPRVLHFGSSFVVADRFLVRVAS